MPMGGVAAIPPNEVRGKQPPSPGSSGVHDSEERRSGTDKREWSEGVVGVNGDKVGTRKRERGERGVERHWLLKSG